jgi:hypothetical protein
MDFDTPSASVLWRDTRSLLGVLRELLAQGKLNDCLLFAASEEGGSTAKE